MTGNELIHDKPALEDLADSDVCGRCGEVLPFGWSDDGLCDDCQQWEEHIADESL